MVKKLIITLATAVIFIGAAAGAGDDTFGLIKQQLMSAPLVKFDIKHILTSLVFGSTDTTFGTISLAEDGRYSMKLNNDIYLFDGQCFWEYSGENSQATKRCLKDGEPFSSELFFLKDLDKYYLSVPVKKNIEYRLTLRDTLQKDDLPDSLNLFIINGNLRAIEYYDINDDLNLVEFEKIDFLESSDSNVFKIHLPDSVEIISLP